MAPPSAWNVFPLLGLLACSYIAGKTQFQRHRFLEAFLALGRVMCFILSCLVELAVIAGLDICLSCLLGDVQGREYI